MEASSTIQFAWSYIKINVIDWPEGDTKLDGQVEGQEEKYLPSIINSTQHADSHLQYQETQSSIQSFESCKTGFQIQF